VHIYYGLVHHIDTKRSIDAMLSTVAWALSRVMYWNYCSASCQSTTWKCSSSRLWFLSSGSIHTRVSPPIGTLAWIEERFKQASNCERKVRPLADDWCWRWMAVWCLDVQSTSCTAAALGPSAIEFWDPMHACPQAHLMSYLYYQWQDWSEPGLHQCPRLDLSGKVRWWVEQGGI